MNLYADPTELRSGTRLDSNAIKIAKSLPGLESITGADLMLAPDDVTLNSLAILDCDKLYRVKQLSCHSIPLPQIASDIDRPLPFVLGAIQFIEAAKKSLLIQRKSGQDFPSSIPDLSTILEKMRRWTDRPWLFLACTIECLGNGKARVDGRTLKWNYESVQGAIRSWQYHGGYVEIRPDDRLILPWLEAMSNKLSPKSEKLIPPKEAPVPLIKPDYKSWIKFLCQFDGIGALKATQLAEPWQSFAAFLEHITRPDLLLQNPDDRPKGFGEKSIRNIRYELGLTDDSEQIQVHSVKGK